MSQYAAGAQLATTANKPMLLLFGDGEVLPEINLIRVGFTATPADELFKFSLYEHINGGTGGTSITPKKIGPGAGPACSARRGSFSTDPTRSGIALVSFTCHRRAAATIQKEFGAGYKPEAIAADRGLGIWCDNSPDSVDADFVLNWWE